MQEILYVIHLKYTYLKLSKMHMVEVIIDFK